MEEKLTVKGEFLKHFNPSKLPNEQWIIELKAKRQAYNVTQLMLANVIGTSRKYIVDLENNRAKLSAFQKEEIEKALETFNPNNPLVIIFDYVRIRFPTSNIEHITKTIMDMDINKFYHEDYGFYSYKEHYRLGDIFVLVDDKTDKGVLIELKGKGCRQFESYLLTQGRTWYDFFVTARLNKGIFKRVDIAINDNVGLLNIPMLIEKCRNKECVSLFRSFRRYGNGELTKENLSNMGMGETLYLGSMRSDIYFCIYQKDYEQYYSYGVDIEDTRTKNRFEIRLRNNRAQNAMKDYLKHNDISATAFSIINNYVRFVDSTGKCKKRESLNKDWERFIKGNGDKISLGVDPKPYSMDKTIEWLKKQIAPTLKLLLAIDELNKTTVIDEMIKKASLSKKQRAILEIEISSIYDMLVSKHI